MTPFPQTPARLTVALLAVVVPLSLTACATTVDETIASAPARASATTVAFVPDGTTAELLAQLLDEGSGLSEAIVENEGKGELMGRLDVLWQAARPDVESEHPELLYAFDRSVAMLQRGVDRRRPADADKGIDNLVTLVDAAT
ncbi:hypothetical protein BH24ACT5_BH24ACT5_19260 [soil metagenome]